MVVRSQAHSIINSPQLDGWLSASLGRDESITQAQSVVDEVKQHVISPQTHRINFLDNLSGGIIISDRGLKVVIDGTVWPVPSPRYLIDAHMFPSRRYAVILTPDNMEVVKFNKTGNKDLEVIDQGGPRKCPGTTALALTPLGKELIYGYTLPPQRGDKTAVSVINSFVFRDPAPAMHRWDSENLEYASQITALRCANYPRRLLAIGHASGRVEIREMARAGVLGPELASYKFNQRGAITTMIFHKNHLFVGNCHGEVQELHLKIEPNHPSSLCYTSTPFKSGSPDPIRALHYVPQNRTLVVWGGCSAPE